MGTATTLKWFTGVFEALLGIPFLGGAFIISNGWTPLFIMLILHIVTLFFSFKEIQNKYGSVLGIVTSVIGWIPVVGMIMHIVTALALLFDAARSRSVYRR
ncbi:membrane protein [Mesobacillus campisalis]|uniref:Membrane protein n=1 Tax=Mesobacillus campisalis TaxID=1408103 RepID=A0A0M2SRH4_9BACI|nr:hypothetical protein [Mesobacillus campisalis]KKK37184.1 membrane protein [Mesobacillus campisalis]